MGGEAADDSMSTTAHTSEVGTTLYASPEQTRGDIGDISEKTDMFSIGVILVELFVPFSTMHHRRDELMRARERQWEQIEDFSDSLCGLELMARECLDPRPDKRPTALTFYNFVEQHRDSWRQKEVEARGGHGAGKPRALSTGGEGGMPSTAGHSLGRQQEASMQRRDQLTVWGTDLNDSLVDRINAVVQREEFGGQGMRVRIVSMERVDGHEQLELKYVLSNVRDGGLDQIETCVLEVEGVLQCRWEGEVDRAAEEAKPPSPSPQAQARGGEVAPGDGGIHMAEELMNG